MRVLVTWPPHVPSYFNAGHHLPTFTVAAYLRAAGHDVRAVDAGALNFSWKEFGDLVFQGRFDAVVVINEFDTVEGVRRAADYVRQLLPAALLVTVGRLSYQNPKFFASLAFDAVVSSGDYEAGVAAALRWGRQGRPQRVRLPGVAVRTAGGWNEPAGPGERLPAEDWVLPDVRDIPYLMYEAMYRNDENRFCGIPERRELVVPVARGCPVGCDFCDVPTMQGLQERRLPVDRVVDYITTAFAEHPFEYVAFYAPTFTLRKPWVRELCRRLRAEPRRYPWKCATTLHHLDEDLVADMAAAGCVRISVGVETFDVEAASLLPRVKQTAGARFTEVLAWCTAAGVELNCFVIVGLPGTSAEATAATITAIQQAGARVRPTVYTPYHEMRPDMTERELSAFNRQTFVDPDTATGGHPDRFLRFIFGGDSYVTEVMGHIPTVVASTADPA
jgi:radical SAM superfamily enzyme YgiQ (UPF0313 family)